MGSTVTAVVIVAALTAWHLSNRRHPGWRASDIGRLFIFTGYPLVAIAAYWLTSASTTIGWEWALGDAFGLGAVVGFVLGFNALNHATAQHADLSRTFETVDPALNAAQHPNQPAAPAQ